MDRCLVCHEPIDACPYGGDCGEVRIIYREQQREKLRDIEIDPELCIECEAPLAKDEVGFCNSCALLGQARGEG